MEKKRLYRSRDDVLVGGVLAGMAEHFDHDPTLWRLGFLVLMILTAIVPCVLIYIGAWIIIPERPAFTYTDVTPEREENE